MRPIRSVREQDRGRSAVGPLAGPHPAAGYGKGQGSCGCPRVLAKGSSGRIAPGFNRDARDWDGLQGSGQQEVPIRTEESGSSLNGMNAEVAAVRQLFDFRHSQFRRLCFGVSAGRMPLKVDPAYMQSGSRGRRQLRFGGCQAWRTKGHSSVEKQRALLRRARGRHHANDRF